MLNQAANLRPDVLTATAGERVSTRDGFGRGVVEAGEKDANVLVLCADLAESTRAQWFRDCFPDRYIEVGVAEQNLAALASGLAAAGKIPFITSYAAFSPGRNWEQIRTTVCLNHMPVKVCGMHAGVSVGPDGATHQMLEDIALMRVLPGMTVIAPADAEEARKATLAAAAFPGPVYLRFGRAEVPTFTTPETPFAVGRGLVLFEAEDPEVLILATGSLSHQALCAAESLFAKHIPIVLLHMPTVKPLDEELLSSYLPRVRGVVTVEEHQVAGGFGSAVAEAVARTHPLPIEQVGVADSFGQSGEPEELLRHYGLDEEAIHKAVLAVRKRAVY